MSNKISTTSQTKTVSFNPFAGPIIEKVIHTTASQAEIWIGCSLGGEDANRAYNESVSLILKGNLNINALETAIQDLVKRHEALRSTFSPDGLFISVLNEISIVPFFQDISNYTPLEKDRSVSGYLSRDAHYSFNLAKGPLIKFGLLKLSELEHQLIITAHHIVCDGWSMGIILQDIGNLYSAAVTNTNHTLPKVNDFSTYADEQQEFINSIEFENTQKYWLKQYQDSIPTVTLPTDFPRPKIRTFKSNRLDFPISNELVADLKKVGIKSGASFVVTLMTAFEVFLYFQTGQDDLSLGLSAAGQSVSGKNNLVGHCVNLLPLRSKIVPNTPFNSYLKNRKEDIFDAYDHQQFSFSQLLERLNIERDTSRIPLVPVVFNIDMGMTNDVVFNGLNYKLKSNPRAYEAFELFLNATGTEDELILEWSYNTALFNTTTIENMMSSFKDILHNIVANPNIEIGNLTKIDSSTSLKLNDTNLSSSKPTYEKINHLNEEEFLDYSEEKNIIDLFLAQVKSTPNNTAVSFENKTLTYSELDNLSNQFANHLIDSHRVKNGDLVSVMLDRSEWIIVCALGILKSGAAYVPIEPNYPEKRKNYIIEDSQCKITIDHGFINNFINKLDELSLEFNHAVKIVPEDLCYIIYTSGTTGNPKGVMIEHRNVVSLMFHGQGLFNFNANDVWTMFHSFCFDFSVWEMYGALLFGGKLIIVPQMVAKDPFQFISMIEKEGVTVLNQTPSAFINLMESVNDSSLNLKLRYIIFGGEALFPKHLKSWYIQYPKIKFVNMYGITETTVHVTYKDIRKEEIENNKSNIGNCISTLTAYILDEFKNPQPEGVVGELYISGKGVARGYLNRPELTNERFLPNPFNKRERMYRSGDLAKKLPNGELEYMGRIDDQVKIRGYRIEIKEVEAAINSLPNIKNSVVITSDHLAGELSLVAYLQPFNFKGDSNNIRTQLGEILPDFQIPSTFMWVDKFPLTTNGKIDKKNLPSPEYERTDSNTALNLPQTELEKDIAKIWSELLQIPIIHVEDNFFKMGGSSLLAQRVVGSLRKKLNKEIPLIKIFQHPTISQLAQFLGENSNVEAESETILTTVSSKVTTSLSHLNSQKPKTNTQVNKRTQLVIKTTRAQSEILTDCFYGGDDAKKGYNISFSFKFEGHLNYDALELAIQSLVERHQSLRSSFSEDLQSMHIYSDFNVNILYHDISNQVETDKLNTIKTFINDDVNYLFDLINGPLLKFNLVKINEHNHELIVLVNHAICDGLSTSVFIEELATLYTAFAQGQVPTLNKLDRFSVFADKENKFADSNAHKRSVEFWLNMYKETVPKLELPIDYPRPKLRTYNNNHLDFEIDNTLLHTLKQIGNNSNSSMFTSIVTTLLAAFEVFLYKQTGQNDLVLGLISSTRANHDMMQMIGHSVNLLPLRSKVDSKLSFNDYLNQRNKDLFEVYENQSISFGNLLEKLSIPRDPSRVPLVPVIINIQLDDVIESKNSFYDLSTEIRHNENNYRTFEIELQVFMSNDKPCFRWRYNTTLFKPSSIEGMMKTFESVLHSIVKNPEVSISKIIDIDVSAYTKLNDTKATYPNQTLNKLLSEQAIKYPKHIALKFENTQITYEDLEQKVNQLTHSLIAQGISPGDFVGVCLPRSIELIITLRAIMQCGAAYVPLDPSYPIQRLNYMLDDSEAKFLITTTIVSSTLSLNATVLIQDDLFLNLNTFSSEPISVEINQNNIVYLLYTSGSTGKPKGVSITHKNLVNLLYSFIDKPGIKETDTLISITTISFDIAMAELFAPLLKGAKLILTNEETAKDTRLLLDVMTNESVTMMQATPATWQMLLDSGWDKHLPIRAISTGEALPLELAQKILNSVNELWNLYGPTETTIWSAMTQITETCNSIPIGRPLANTQLYIVNEENNLVAPGIIGELCIAGDGVSNGYWKRPELTADKFITNHFNTDTKDKLYRTGDLAKLLPNGDVLCLGRIDNQVKIRGQRIELGEIEQALDALEGVQSSVVLLNENRLVAHLIASEIGNENTIEINAWKTILKEKLPTHMIPQHFNVLKEFPVTLNGKIDRNALLNLTPKPTKASSFTEPSTPSEKIILDIWKDCLDLEKIDINDDYFEIGGHSLIGVKVMARLEKETGNRVPLVALLKHSTIKKLAAYMDHEFFTWDSLVPLKPEGSKPPLYIVHGANHQVLLFNELAQRLDKDQPVYGLQSRGLNGIDQPHDSINDMAADYVSEIIASNPEGPYALAGFSYGGIVAYEMARQLKAQGKEVKILAQFDTYIFPDYYYQNPFKKKVLGVIYNIGKMGYLLLNMFSSKKNFKRRLALLKLQFKGLKLRLKHGKAKQYEMQFNVSSKLAENHSIATSNYTITPQDIVIDLFRAREEINFVHDPKYLGWKNMPLKGIRKHMVDGNHVDMFEAENVQDFATSLQYVLDHHNSNSYE
ncbi:amino acid adenylation domain-containing protein [Psychroserpens damuponensis]|uniref:amino acid adenylation domain-containing protein n=1 Tax=Psychroserpens damuponensis TaxID=943936 RepID=UPI00058D869A|nr:non-ribosomal peptide synthetase [Psychroserpens damuponensis]